MSVKTLTIDLHGYTVADATQTLETALNKCFMQNYSELIIIHGKGTGKLKSAIQRYLDASDLDLNYHSSINNAGQMVVRFPL